MTKAVHLYLAYGLTIGSEFELPELVKAAPGQHPDVTIRLTTFDRPFPSGPEYFSFSETTQIIDFQAVGKFEIKGLDQVLVEPRTDVPADLIRLPLLGSVFALLLHLRGHFVLHASAVNLTHGCVGFLGDKRAGKSTTAAALIKRGHPLITDDVLALELGDSVSFTPGFPQIKLTDASASATKVPSRAKVQLITLPGFDKHQHDVSERFTQTPFKPLRLYKLERAPEAKIEIVSVTEAFQILMRYSYLVRFGKDVLSTRIGPAMLRQAADLASRNLVRVLTLPDSLDRVEEIGPLVEADAES